MSLFVPSPVRRSFGLRLAVLIFVAAALALSIVGPAAAAPNSIEQPDVGGQFTSLKLDGSGFPVVSHFDPGNGKLKVVHCGNANCSGGNTLTAPDTMTVMVPGVAHTSLALAGGVPVVSHYDAGPKDLKFVHCGNAVCGSPTLRTLDAYPPIDNSGIYGSIAINGSGNPVIAYYYEPTDNLRVLTCNDATCSSYVIQDVDAGTGTLTGQMPSLVLDSSGFPVISYYNYTNQRLKLARCSNATCSTGVTINIVDVPSTGVGQYSSLALDGSGLPVISYYDDTNDNLKVAHCSDATCTSASVTVPDAAGSVGAYTSLALDSSGNPVISYYNATGTALKVLHCVDPACATSTAAATPDGLTVADVGKYSSLALDAAGNPVVSYYDVTNAKLSVLHCGDPLCAGSAAAVGGVTELTGVSATSGRASVSPWLLVAGLGAAAVGLMALGRGWFRR